MYSLTMGTQSSGGRTFILKHSHFDIYFFNFQIYQPDLRKIQIVPIVLVEEMDGTWVNDPLVIQDLVLAEHCPEVFNIQKLHMGN